MHNLMLISATRVIFLTSLLRCPLVDCDLDEDRDAEEEEQCSRVERRIQRMSCRISFFLERIKTHSVN